MPDNLQDRLARLSPAQRQELARRLQKADSPRPRANPSDRAPLSSAQQRLWLLDQLDPANPAWNLAVNYRVRGALDIPRLAAALNQLAARHEILRTTFEPDGAIPFQKIAPALELDILLEDLTDSPAGLALSRVEGGRESQGATRLREWAREPYDLACGPLIRLRLIRLAPDQHLLHLGQHHIISDEWSIGNLTRELAALYAGETLPPLPLQYADFAAWEGDWLTSDAAEKNLAYWQGKLGGELHGKLPVLQLPTDCPRPARRSFDGAKFSQRLPAALTDRLRALARGENASLFMLVLTAWNFLLARYTGQREIITGAPNAGRTHPELEPLIGFFLNTLPIRLDLHGNPAFRAALAAARTATLEALAHQAFPLARLLDKLQLERDLSQSPLFQTLVIFQPPLTDLALPGLDLEYLPVDAGVALYDISLYAADLPAGLHLNWEYNTALFHEATIARMARHFEHLLTQITANPDTPLAQLDLLTPAEHAQLREWNATGTPYPAGDTLPALFRAQTARTPNAAAFTHGDRTLTYQQLADRTGELTAQLWQAGIRPGGVVGICLPRSFDMVAGLLAIAGCGAAWLPLDPSYPADRLAYMLADAGATLILSDSHTLARLQPTLPTLLLDALPDLAPRTPHPAPRTPPLTPESPAYLIYTSGSTGQPKGVSVPHRQIANRLHWMWQAYPFQPGEIASQRTPLSFVDSIWEIFGALLQGAPTAILDDDTVRDPAALVDALAQQGITRLWLVPSLLRVLLDQPNLAQRLPQLTFWVTTGEPLPAELHQRFSASLPRARLYNLYGTSEVWDATWWEPAERTTGTIPIGKPLPNVTAWVLDEDLNACPVGVPGMLHIGGDNLAHGYLGKPGLTAERFVPNPFLEAEKEKRSRGAEEQPLPALRLYRTGDRARWLPDGNLEFLGRADLQVKIRGQRVELGEVEAALRQHEQVRNAVVTAAGDNPETRSLAAYLVCHEGADVSRDGLRAFLRARLPEFMIPAYFDFLPELPLTPSRKINRLALPKPEQNSAAAFIPPQNVFEHQLARIWEQVLGVGRVGTADNFFDLGGNSLLAIRMFDQIYRQMGRKLPLATLFQHPTIAQLAGQLEKQDTGRWETVIDIQPRGTRPPLFFVHGFGGGVLGYQELARRMGPDQPFLGVIARGLDGQDPPHQEIVEMAEFYLGAIRKIQPRGPYYLGGYCFGGVVAFEMARQLQAVGEETRLLAVLEGFAPIHEEKPLGWWHPKILGNFILNLPYWLADFWKLGWGQMRLRAARKARAGWLRLRSRLGLPVEVDLASIIEDISGIPEDHQRLMEIHVRAMMRYRPPVSDIPVTLFRVRAQSLFGRHDEDNGWGRLAGAVEVRMIEGAHRNILEMPHVATLADELNAVLDNLFAKGANHGTR